MAVNKKGLIWGIVIAGVGVGVYFLTDKLLKTASKDAPDAGNEETGEAEVGVPTIFVAPDAQVAPLNLKKWLMKGVEAPNEIKKLQIILNDIRGKARGRQGTDSYKNTYSDYDRKRIDTVASLPILKVDGNFGTKTETSTQTILGKKGTDVCTARGVRTAFALKYGYVDPYKNWNKIC
jgi:hypothetical protein